MKFMLMGMSQVRQSKQLPTVDLNAEVYFRTDEIRLFTALWFFTVIYCSLTSVPPFLSPNVPSLQGDGAGRSVSSLGCFVLLMATSRSVTGQHPWLSPCVQMYTSLWSPVYSTTFRPFPNQDHHPFLFRLPSFWSHFLGTSLFNPEPWVPGFPNPNSLYAEVQCVVSLTSSLSISYLFIYWRIENMMLLF